VEQISLNTDITKEQELVLWNLIDIFDKQGLLPYVMLIGSWSELIYDNNSIPALHAATNRTLLTKIKLHP